MDNRFAQAAEQEAKFDESGEVFFKSSMELAKEIADKGSRGVELTANEKDFVKSMTMFMLRGLIGQGGG